MRLRNLCEVGDADYMILLEQAQGCVLGQASRHATARLAETRVD